MEYNIDLHVHSRSSGDSDADPEELVLQAIRIGLHGIAFTEHYSYEASEPAEVLKEKYRNDIIIFRGVEFSTAEGHCLIFGVNTDKLLSAFMSIKDAVRIVDQHGGILIPSHPFRGINSLGDRVKRTKGICAIEGYNGCNLHAFNARAVETAAELNLPFTGGSDAHDSGSVGLCYTTFSDKLSHDNFISVMKAGNFRGVDTRKISQVSFAPAKK
ncbi:MAG TPA: PHP domain-containing protein [Dissulfurispiraceae bacterium]|nr:PHP domain-containing protein [Dissulfurispiraceae bacterium]